VFRQRYRLFASALYIVFGVIIIVRSIVAQVLPLILLGVVLVALGAIQIRGYLAWRHTTLDK
jgi:uncharacterized membrane protein HdeD (DUF308 family)